ncbi:CAP domain-containing protein [Actinoplanes awajinensis]|uniref:RNA polymerase subunit sigma-70 n=1 Tax=Actinoplanes awajinensis subsp. mycoplanecinus TaxID=135947 RepID=A0A0X3V782_9ACTN|nr:CAP domain-containing protein [Actinoplanes awajinensis]KUL40474.1 RNA polymerase subunit sigma-70 [Actinoplanes awajinensis subsp. mycoplanecinus]
MSLSAAARFRYTLVAGTTAVVIGSGFTVAGLMQRSSADPSPRSADVPFAAAAADPSTDAGLLTDEDAFPASAAPSASSSPTPRASASKKPTATPAVRKTTTAPATKKTTKTATTAGGGGNTAPATADTILDLVLAHINAARVDEGLSELTLDTKLSKASAIHNQLMIDGCGLAHVCDGESDIGDRFSAQGVSWSSAGENIGYGSSGSSAADMVKAANGLTDSMLAEVPPNDGHRKNLLSKSFKKIGLSVVRDDKGITWMTQDFVG